MSAEDLATAEDGNYEKEFMEETAECCKKEGPDFPNEANMFEDTQFYITNKENDFTKDNFVEEEWELRENLKVDNQKNSGDDQRNSKSYSLKEAERNIIFEDNEVLKADLFVCKSCHRVFVDEYKLQSHMYKVHNTEKVTSSDVHELDPPEEHLEDKWTPDVQRLARRVGSGKVFECDQCSYTVTRCDSMTKHVLRVHSKGRVKPQHMCEVCGKIFVDRAYLRNHGLSHIQEPQYFCEICGRRFHRQPSLKRHLQSHSDEKQFSCSLCDYKTNRKHLMYKHAENHRTGKAFSCKHCNDKFFTQISLRKHCYAHHPSRHTCSFCQIGFSSRERMWSHMHKIHFACEITDLKTEDSAKHDNVEYIEVKLEPKSC